MSIMDKQVQFLAKTAVKISNAVIIDSHYFDSAVYDIADICLYKFLSR
jgi:hypothetical protein